MSAEAVDDPKSSGRFVWIFLGLTCLLSWPIWLLSGVLPRGGQGPYDFRWLVTQIGVFGPSLSALILSGTFGPEQRRSSLRTIPVLLMPLVVPGVLVALAAPSRITSLPLMPSVAAVAVGALILFFFSPLNRRFLGPANGNVQAKPEARWVFLSVTFMPVLFLVAWVVASARSKGLEISALQGGILASTWTVLVCFAHNLLLGGSLGEEIGWRGFLLPELLKTRTPVGASILLGVAWGLWHLPIDLYAGFGLTGFGAVLMRVLYAIPVSILFTWLYLRARGSILVALLLHTSLNLMGDLGLSGYEATGTVFFFVVMVTALLVAVFSPVFRRET